MVVRIRSRNPVQKIHPIIRGYAPQGYISNRETAAKILALAFQMRPVFPISNRDIMYHDNIIYLTGEPIGCEYLRSEP